MNLDPKLARWELRINRTMPLVQFLFFSVCFSIATMATFAVGPSFFQEMSTRSRILGYFGFGLLIVYLRPIGLFPLLLLIHGWSMRFTGQNAEIISSAGIVIVPVEHLVSVRALSDDESTQLFVSKAMHAIFRLTLKDGKYYDIYVYEAVEGYSQVFDYISKRISRS